MTPALRVSKGWLTRKLFNQENHFVRKNLTRVPLSLFLINLLATIGWKTQTGVLWCEPLVNSAHDNPKNPGSLSSWWPFRGLSPVPPILGSTGIPLKFPLPAPKCCVLPLHHLLSCSEDHVNYFRTTRSEKHSQKKKKKCTITFWVVQNQIGQDTSGVRGDHKKKSAA